MHRVPSLVIALILLGETQIHSLGDQTNLAVKIYEDLLKNHRVTNTGLFLSFPNTRDKKISQEASTYDQAAIGLLALELGDDDAVEKTLRFFQKQWGSRGLSNFYNAYFGSPGIEKIAHAGPNVWVGLLAARAARLEHNKTGRALALKIACWTRELPHTQGGISMGMTDDPGGSPWHSVYSTENNISYAAFLNELLKLDISLDERKAAEAERRGVEHWITHVAYQKESGLMLRGINPLGPDRVQALDTYTWLILALGADRLREQGLDVHRLLMKAENLFEVRLGSQQGVDGTDLSQANLVFSRSQALQMARPARPLVNHHRLIWYEGLGHYILCLKKMSAPSEKVDAFIRSFDLGRLGSGIPTRFPYSTEGELFADHVSPLNTPHDPSPALISAVWRAFVALDYNPLNNPSTTRPLNGREQAAVRWESLGIEAYPEEMILYGTSEDMLNKAWHHLQWEENQLALEQAQAVIEEWSLWAHEQQARKKLRSGGLLPYDGTPERRQKILSDWALNDVAAACFIRGQVLYKQGKYAQARAAFNQIFQHYSLGQIWDPKGWFWSPAQAAYKDFIEPNPKLFGLASLLMAAQVPDEVPSPN